MNRCAPLPSVVVFAVLGLIGVFNRPAVCEDYSDIWSKITLTEKATTPAGIQVAEAVDQAADEADLSALSAVDDTPQPDDDLFALISTVSKDIGDEFGRQQSVIRKMREKTVAADASDQPAVIAGQLTQAPLAATPPALARVAPDADTENFRRAIFDSFGPRLFERPGESDPSIVVVDSSSGKPVSSETVKIAFVKADGTTMSTSTTTDDRGKAQFSLAKGDSITDLRVGGDRSPVSRDDLRLVRIALDGFDTSELLALPPAEQQRIVSLFGNAYEMYMRLVTGRDPDVRAVCDLRDDEKRRRVKMGAALLSTMLGGKNISAVQLLAVEAAVTARLNAMDAWKSLGTCWKGISLATIAGRQQIAVTNRPLQIGVKLLEALPSDEVRKAVIRLVRPLVPQNAALDVQIIDRRELTCFVSIAAPSVIDRQALQSALTLWVSSNPNVAFAEVPRLRTALAIPNDPHFLGRGAWGQAGADQHALHETGVTKEFCKDRNVEALRPCAVAVLGSGVDWTHAELRDQMWVNLKEQRRNGKDDDANGFTDDLFGWNFRDNSNDVIDRGGHDTVVAGIVSARWNNRRGIVGANPLARIMALKIANFEGQADSVTLSRAIRYAVDNGARVINISYGGRRPSLLEEDAVSYAVKRDVVVVVPTGNESRNSDNHALLSYPGVIVVAGSAGGNQRAGFSNWGRHVDIAAPSIHVLGLRAKGTDFLAYQQGTGQEYRPNRSIVGAEGMLYRASGTSFAAALVSGAASLLLSHRPDLSAKQVENLLLNNAVDIDVPGWDRNTGRGRVHVGNALTGNPDDWAIARIDEVRIVGRRGNRLLVVRGTADASDFHQRMLQIAFGDRPQETDWRAAATNFRAVNDGLLASIRGSTFERRGPWSVRLVVTDGRGHRVTSRARVLLD